MSYLALNLQKNKFMAQIRIYLVFSFFLLANITGKAQSIPLPEHPRPDWNRPQWQNLNGVWNFRFDKNNIGVDEQWQNQLKAFAQQIVVPYSWAAPLSGLTDEADIGWYHRTITIAPGWQGKRIYLVIGAADWETSVWLDGKLLGTHQGGYIPFEFELTEEVQYGQAQELVIRVDDLPRWQKLNGKQQYGEVRGIWQTPYLEARGDTWIEFLHCYPDIDREKLDVHLQLDRYLAQADTVTVAIKTPNGKTITQTKEIRAEKDMGKFSIPIPNPRLWTLDDPYLYELTATIAEDTVHTYFGMRKISVVDLPGTDYPYVALNDEPVYLQLALDQAYHPEGFYTFPSDDFIRTELERSKAIGLNGLRPHIKVPIPRKLYWADKLGLLIMADVPQTRNDPNEDAQLETEFALRGMIKRDFNHPSIFSWVNFNESWGLREQVITDTSQRMALLPWAYQRAASMYYLTKSLDPTRLVDDNSIHSYWVAEHTITDLNSSHDYLAGQQWEARLRRRTEYSYPGSTFQYAEGFAQRPNTPSINAECGNVWGYYRTASDVDWAWDYHRMVNTFRKYPEMAGWVYTELHDVIKEWNGYWKYDRSPKFTGLPELVEGMDLTDFHAPVYLSTGNEICRTISVGDTLHIPLWISSMTNQNYGSQLRLEYEIELTNQYGVVKETGKNNTTVPYTPWLQQSLPALKLPAFTEPGLAIVRLRLSAKDGQVLHHNFFHLEITDKQSNKNQLTVQPDAFTSAQWSDKKWSILNGKKMNGAGSGHFTYTFTLPDDWVPKRGQDLYFLAELSSKPLLVKDMTDAQKTAQGIELNTHRKYPDDNPNAYPMTDEVTNPSPVDISCNGQALEIINLPDDPADHQGVLSWHHQDLPPTDYQTWDADNWGGIERQYKLQEAGTYGYLTKVKIPRSVWRAALKSDRQLEIKLATEQPTGIAVYGAEFGRYAVPVSLYLEGMD